MELLSPPRLNQVKRIMQAIYFREHFTHPLAFPRSFISVWLQPSHKHDTIFYAMIMMMMMLVVWWHCCAISNIYIYIFFVLFVNNLQPTCIITSCLFSTWPKIFRSLVELNVVEITSCVTSLFSSRISALRISLVSWLQIWFSLYGEWIGR